MKRKDNHLFYSIEGALLPRIRYGDEREDWGAERWPCHDCGARKAYLLMAGTGANPGPHDYELVVRDQVEANRHAHRVRLVEAGEIVSFGGRGDLTEGRDALADPELTADGLHAHCD